MLRLVPKLLSSVVRTSSLEIKKEALLKHLNEQREQIKHKFLYVDDGKCSIAWREFIVSQRKKNNAAVKYLEIFFQIAEKTINDKFNDFIQLVQRLTNGDYKQADVNYFSVEVIAEIHGKYVAEVKSIPFAEIAGVQCEIHLDFPSNPVLFFCEVPHWIDKKLIPGKSDSKDEKICCPIHSALIPKKNCAVKLPQITALITDYKPICEKTMSALTLEAGQISTATGVDMLVQRIVAYERLAIQTKLRMQAYIAMYMAVKDLCDIWSVEPLDAKTDEVKIFFTELMRLMFQASDVVYAEMCSSSEVNNVADEKQIAGFASQCKNNLLLRFRNELIGYINSFFSLPVNYPPLLSEITKEIPKDPVVVLTDKGGCRVFDTKDFGDSKNGYCLLKNGEKIGIHQVHKLPEVTKIIADYQQLHDQWIGKARLVTAPSQVMSLISEFKAQEGTVCRYHVDILGFCAQFRQKRRIAALVDRLKLDANNIKHMQFWMLYGKSGKIPECIQAMMAVDYKVFVDEKCFITKLNAIQADAKSNRAITDRFASCFFSTPLDNIIDAEDIRTLKLTK